MNTSLSNLYAELAMSRVQFDEDEFILDLISKQLNQISERENHVIVLIKQRRDGLAKDIRKLEKRIVEQENRR
jgi:nucleoside-triphosphatase THEP1